MMRLCAFILCLSVSSATFVIAEEVTLKTAPAVVVQTVPAAGSKRVDPELTHIKITFSKRMMDKTWSVTSGGMDMVPEISNLHYEKDGRTCSMKVALEPNQTYGMWFNLGKNMNFKDADGQSSVPYLLVFETGSEN